MVSQMFVDFPPAFRGTIQVVYVPGWPHKAKVVFLKSSKTIESFQFTVDKRSGSNVHKQKIIQGGLGTNWEFPKCQFLEIWRDIHSFDHSALRRVSFCVDWVLAETCCPMAQFISLRFLHTARWSTMRFVTLFFKGGCLMFCTQQKLHKSIIL